MDEHFKKLVDEETPRPGLIMADEEWRVFEALQILPGGRSMLARDMSLQRIYALAVSNKFCVLAGGREELKRFARFDGSRVPAVGALVLCHGMAWRVVDSIGGYLCVRAPDGRHDQIGRWSDCVRVIWSPSEPAQDFVFMRPCACCGEQRYNRDLTRARDGSDDLNVCPDCLEELFEECGGCGEYFPKQSLNGRGLCDSCFEDRYFVCAHCGEAVERDEGIEHEGDMYCGDCFDDLFRRCERCGDIVDADCVCYDEDSGEALCEDCYNEGRQALHDHGYSKDATTVFHGDDSDMYYGIELEMESRKAGVEAVAFAIKDPAEEDWSLEEDASLVDGIEVVSQPRTFKSWQDFWPEYDRRILAVARDFGCTAHDNGRCGIHIHTSLDAWDEGQLLRLFALAYNPDNYSKLLKVSQRTEDQLSEWASLRLEDVGSCRAKDKIKNKESPFYRRTAALNITEKTLEVRLFRSSTRLDRVMKCLEFVHALYCYTAEAKRATWKGLMLWTRRHKKTVPSLFSYLEEIGLIEKKRRPRAAADARRKTCAA